MYNKIARICLMRGYMLKFKKRLMYSGTCNPDAELIFTSTFSTIFKASVFSITNFFNNDFYLITNAEFNNKRYKYVKTKF